MDDDFQLLIASFQRARESDELFDTFYALFLSRAPEIRGMFSHTDFHHQKLMLRESLLELLIYFQTRTGDVYLRRLARRHAGFQVEERHFQFWLDSLCKALAAHDPNFTEELNTLWREAMQDGIDVMVNELKKQR